MIDILLATYNGERYLRTQLLSIVGQSFSDWRLLVHDDGSTDTTVDIVRQFGTVDKRICLIEDGASHLGAGRNFMHLLQYSTAPYCCFCDQDDLWFEDRLKILHEAISKKNNSIPQVIYANGYDWYVSNGYKIGKYSIPCRRYSIKDTLFMNGGIQGCASIYNAKMRDFINIPHLYIAMHDQILMYAGIICGGIDYIKEPLFLYRQHDNNATSHQPQTLKSRIENIVENRHIPVVEKVYYEGCKSFYNMYKGRMSESDLRFFEFFLLLPDLSFFNKVRCVIKNKFSWRNSVLILLIKIFLRRFIN